MQICSIPSIAKLLISMKIHVPELPMIMWVVLISSIPLNNLLIKNIHPYYINIGRDQHKLSWSRGAAEEAEAVASISCSGHGRVALDGMFIEGKPICQCNSCYGGDDCSILLPDCAVDAHSGNPRFLEPYWRKNAASSTVVVAGWHRLGYTYEDDSYMSRELGNVIQKLHAVVGNANTTGKYILFGAGATQLLNAAIMSLSQPPSQHSNDGGNCLLRTNVVASAPFYPVCKMQTEMYNSLNFKWRGDPSSWKNKSDSSENFIEVVTSPSNPEGKLKDPVLKGASVKTIYDYAYYWPHYTGISSPANTDLMIFTLSKLTGHGGSRFGWAFVKDKAVYERMAHYLEVNSVGASQDAQLRALVLLRTVLKDDGREFFGFGHKTLRERLVKLNRSLSKSKRFSLQKLSPHNCSFFNQVTDPSPAYGWVKCVREEDRDCAAVLKSAGILGKKGSYFSADDKYVRLNLIGNQDDFDLLLRRMDTLVSQE
ncbi:hypothetical protein Sjap_010316 [Stephania japonica]|uniref:Alliinase n=1 Tax=Stephania japonica TaxID=461633 RepID=A0AAP0J9D1_9MAGN